MTDIEDIANVSVSKSNMYISQELFEPLKNLLIDLCGKEYDSEKTLKEEMIILRRKYGISPRKVQIFYMYENLLSKKIIKENNILRDNLKSKEMRGLSGVIVISVLTSPYPNFIDNQGKEKTQKFSCKHDCFYCPKEVDDTGKEINPRSYLSDEPAVSRALTNNYDPIEQFNDRGTQYIVNGHYVDKIEIIILGGTWTEYPKDYQEDFIRKIYWAANTFYETNKRSILSLTEEQTINESSKSRIIGLTLEMRPDSINDEEIQWLRYLGCTRVQLGNQHIDNEILKGVNRGCYKEDSEKALKILKDNCFKVDAHWMPDLPGSSPEKDKKMFEHIINSEKLQFDQWKVYPTATVPWTKIKDWYDEGKYIPYTEKNPEDLVDVLLEMMKNVPPWIRLNRVIRDIPNKTRNGDLYIYAGNKITNLRQILDNRLIQEKSFCSCIRSREVKKNIKLIKYAICIVREYLSSDGKEYFISIESGDHKDSIYKNNNWYNNDIREKGIIYGFLRLRITPNSGNKYFPELKKTALIRELHVYGQVTTQRKINSENAQHTGFGKILMKKAEEISIQNGYKRICVISGIGVRNYYRKLNYKLVNTFMIKELNHGNIYYKYSIFMICIAIIIHHLSRF